LQKEKVLVIGLGEVGTAMFSLLKESGKFEVYGLDLDKAKMKELKQRIIPNEIATMHICLPCKDQDKFVDVVTGYARRFKPALIIINSTVPPGTTMSINDRCDCLVADSPFRGVHENPEHMKWELKRWTKYVGGAIPEAGKAAVRHFKKLGLKTKMLKSCRETELAKLFETTYRAWMITCFQEMHRIANYFRADFEDVVDFIADTHRVRLDRPVMFPDVIGRHCVVPNVELILERYDSKLLRLILESNEKRKEEMEDPEVKREVGKIKQIAEELQKDITKRL
jgi:UDP-N-acetyl-D-mannosaminuronate dehydrogenase